MQGFIAVLNLKAPNPKHKPEGLGPLGGQDFVQGSVYRGWGMLASQPFRA